LPITLTVWVTVAVVVATLFEAIPMFLIRSNIPTIATVTPYTPLELAGRDIYVGEGCYNCHSQMIRPILAETKRYGEYSKPGEFVYDHPFQWGSRRIGPDLGREGGRQSNLWHWQHLENPSALVLGSVMPAYPQLGQQLLNFNEIPPRVEAARFLGADYPTDSDQIIRMARTQAEEIAADIANSGGPTRLQDRRAIALIAYLQRLGVDLFRTPAPAETPSSEAPAAAAVTAEGEPAASEEKVTVDREGQPAAGATAALAP
jgi:cytochrome c oxidase cbb3-type subunit I/II